MAETEAEPYTVTLATTPSAPVTVGVTSADPPGALTYTADNWNTAQAVTASAVDDMNEDGETVTHRVTGSGATEYPTTLAAAVVTVQVTDDDAEGLALSGRLLTVEEAAATAGTYTVVLHEVPTGPVTVAPATLTFGTVGLNTEPTGDVALQAAGSGALGATVWLRFTPGGWQTAHALWDGDEDRATARLEHGATGEDYGAGTTSLEVVVTDTPMTITPGSPVLPAIVPSSLTFRERQRVRVQLPAATQGDAPLTYTLTPALPAGLAYDATRRIVGAPQAALAATVYTHRPRVTDADGDTATQTVSITIEGNPRPTFNQQQAATYRRGDPYPLPAPAGTYGRRLAFALTPALPDGLWYTPPVPTGGRGRIAMQTGARSAVTRRACCRLLDPR